MTKFQEKIKAYIASGYPMLLVETQEEDRVMAAITEVVQADPRIDFYDFDVARGMVKIEEDKIKPVNGTAGEPGPVLAQILGIKFPEESKKKAVVVMKDYHTWILPNFPLVIRRLRSMIGHLKRTPICLIFVSPAMDVPKELEKDMQVVPFPLPTMAELMVVFNRLIEDNVEKGNYTPVETAITALMEAAAGMTQIAAQNAFALAIRDSGARHDHKVIVDAAFIKMVFEEKIVNLKQSALEYIPMTSGFETVGGLNNGKSWIKTRRKGFDLVARALHLPYPRGVLLVGFPGTGKTVLAMAIAHEFGFPLFKMDLGRLFGSLVGSSEAKTREVIQLMEAMGSAVILLDEIEKGLSSAATSGKGDSGVSSRMLGTPLTWMSLKTCPVFLVGTLNNVFDLPPALIRPGRFDARFLVDLPTADERVDIFRSLLIQKYGFKMAKDGSFSYQDVPNLFNAHNKELIAATEDATGAEIEYLIQESLYRVLEDPMGMPSFYTHLLSAAEAMEPQAAMNPEEVKKLRELKGFLPAGAPHVKKARKERSVSLN